MKQELSQRFSQSWLYLLKRAFQSVNFNVNHVVLRKFFGKYAYTLFRGDVGFKNITEHGFISFALMHDSTEPSLTYGNIILEGSYHNIDLFALARKVTYSQKLPLPPAPRAPASLDRRAY